MAPFLLYFDLQQKIVITQLLLNLSMILQYYTHLRTEIQEKITF